MNILTLDIASKRTGWAFGPAGSIPDSGSVRVRRDGQLVEVACGNLTAFIQDRFWTIPPFPDIVCVEDYLHPAASQSGDATIAALLTYGAVQGFLRRVLPDDKIVAVRHDKYRKHFMGRAHFKGREETNWQMVRRCHMLGYMPKSDDDIDRAAACGMWEWVMHVHLRLPSKRLELFSG
jgi:hypothetical protein